MAVKLIDLQLIYGVAGAQEKFEQLVTQLVKGEYPTATKVRTVQGDGGIDVYVGEFTDPVGIDVYQAKYFLKEVGKSQKAQIRDSFTTIQCCSDFKAKSWTLCLPINMTAEETEWFEGWKAKQSGIEIRQPWDETKLESLLMASKNHGVKEAFFKEEHLTQIREMHGMMQSLLNRIEEWFREAETEQKQSKETDVLSRQTKYVQDFFRDIRKEHAGLMGQRAKERGNQGRLPAVWEVVIRPSWIPEHPRIEPLRQCRAIVESSQVGGAGWRLPETLSAERTSGPDWAGGIIKTAPVQCWRLSQKGVFAYMTAIPEASGAPPHDSQAYLGVDEVIAQLTMVFRFAAKLAQAAFDPGDGAVEVAIRLTGIANRPLFLDRGILRGTYQSNVPELENTWHCQRAALEATPEQLAVNAALWFFERFNWEYVSEEMVRQFQARILRYI
jgi:hypothetical protein